MLRIDQVSTIERAEDYLVSLEQMPRDESRRLALSHNFRLYHCGGLAALVQVIATWARLHEATGQPTLVPFASKRTADTVLQGLTETLPGLVAVLMAREILSQSYHSSLRDQAYAYARAHVERMDHGSLGETARGRAVTLLCADETSKRALRPLYHPSENGEGILRGEHDFVRLAKKILDAAINKTRRMHLSGQDAEAIGVTLRELFGNTHFHARKDTSGQRYKKSVRGFYAQHHALTGETAERVSKGFTPLGEFFKRSLRVNQSLEQNHFFELSMFDSGPGYAARLLGKALDDSLAIEQEFAAVEQCFLRNVTTRHSHGGGIGLVRVLARLKEKKGFLRIRTGRLSLFKDFSSRDVSEPIALLPDDFLLVDVASDSRVPTQFAPVAGALITVLMPLENQA